MNNILACLGKMLRYAHELELIERGCGRARPQRSNGATWIWSPELVLCCHQDGKPHSTLTMTLKYMHLAPSALTEAIGLLNFGQPVGSPVLGVPTALLQPVGTPAVLAALRAAALLGTLLAVPNEAAACCESLSDVGQTVRTLSTAACRAS